MCYKANFEESVRRLKKSLDDLLKPLEKEAKEKIKTLTKTTEDLLCKTQ